MAFTQNPILSLTLSPAAAGNGNTDNTMVRAFTIFDVSLVCTVTDGGGAATMQLFRQAGGAGAFTSFTNAMACTTSGAVARTTTLVQAQRVFAVGDVLRITLAGGTDAAGAGAENGVAYARFIPAAIS